MQKLIFLLLINSLGFSCLAQSIHENPYFSDKEKIRRFKASKFRNKEFSFKQMAGGSSLKSKKNNCKLTLSFIPPEADTTQLADYTLTNQSVVISDIPFRYLMEEKEKMDKGRKNSYEEHYKVYSTNENGEIELKLQPDQGWLSIYTFFPDKNLVSGVECRLNLNVKKGEDYEGSILFWDWEKLDKPDIGNFKKPVIYFYPETKTEVNVKLDLKGEFKFTYPTYNNGWNFIASPDGSLRMGDKKYNYLFWDAMLNIKNDKRSYEEGFLVEQKDLLPFLEEKLTIMGFNSKEQQDFITYWYPLMSEKKQCYIHFDFKEIIESYAALSVNPKPDNVFRVFMIWADGENLTIGKVKEQVIPTFNRKGFHVLEWGGSNITKEQILESL